MHQCLGLARVGLSRAQLGELGVEAGMGRDVDVGWGLSRRHDVWRMSGGISEGCLGTGTGFREELSKIPRMYEY